MGKRLSGTRMSGSSRSSWTASQRLTSTWTLIHGLQVKNGSGPQTSPSALSSIYASRPQAGLVLVEDLSGS